MDNPAPAYGLENEEVAEFLAECQASSHRSYEAWKRLLQLLEDPQAGRGEGSAPNPGAVRLLHALARAGQADPDLCPHFRFRALELDRGKSPPLVVLELPSVFAPERWSFTFYEGLLRMSPSEWHGRTIAELGCGNGWIALALARRAPTARLYGLDINPRAIVCARINLILQATSEDGDWNRDPSGRGLLERVHFEVSDLLAHCRERGVALDRVIACIPQVLDPDLQLVEAIVPESESDQFLHALSNYCAKQGYIEDQFGLGLVARALEESVESLVPGGKVIFNLGGRPGRAVLQRLFRRRGFEVREVWQVRVEQAADTAIQALVGIENRTQHRFEFFLDPQVDEPVCARTAEAFVRAGGRIYHALSVHEGELTHPTHTRRIFQWLHQDPQHESVLGSVDLTFDDPHCAEEKTAFLAAFAEELSRLSCFPYDDTRGSPAFRADFAEYLRQYFSLPVAPQDLLVAPSRLDLLSNVLALYRPEVVLVDRELLRSAPAELQQRPGCEILECPSRADLVCDLMQALRPQWVFTALPDFENVTPDSFLRLVDTAARTQTRLMVDLSAQLDLASVPRNLGVFKSLASRPLPPHVALMLGLLRNRVYRDLETCFVWASDSSLLASLARAAELTYSRSPWITQQYYRQIVADLLSFRMTGPSPRPEALPGPAGVGPSAPAQTVDTHLAAPVRSAFEHPALEVDQLPLEAPSTVRLDYGENALPTPELVKVALFEAFARQNFSASELDLRGVLASWLTRRLGLAMRPGGAWSIASGVAPLFSAIASSCARERRPLFFPRGSYGHFVASAQFHGADLRFVATQEEDEFRVRASTLREALAGTGPGAVLFLNAPLVNPTGSIYEERELRDIFEVAHRARAAVVLDAVFSGLEFPGETSAWLLEQALPGEAQPDLVVLAGISKELAAGGLRFGFAHTRSEEIASWLSRSVIHRPHATLCHAVRRILEESLQPSAQNREQMRRMRLRLQERAERLFRELAARGWTPLRPRGGLFLVARPSAYLGKRFRWPRSDGATEVVLDADTIVRALFESTGLLINGATWTGLPGFCRFVHSVAEADFERALRCLAKFQSLALG
jgi:methionine S-methyltransferase